MNLWDIIIITLVQYNLSTQPAITNVNTQLQCLYGNYYSVYQYSMITKRSVCSILHKIAPHSKTSSYATDCHLYIHTVSKLDSKHGKNMKNVIVQMPWIWTLVLALKLCQLIINACPDKLQIASKLFEVDPWREESWMLSFKAWQLLLCLWASSIWRW